MKEKKTRDPLLDCPAVKLYREVIHLSLNYLQRQFVAEKVQCSQRGLSIWRDVLTDSMLSGRNPKNIPYMVKLWEGMYYDPARREPNWEDRSNEQWRD